MKGSAETVQDTFLIIAGIVLIIALIAAILPSFINLFEEAALDSPDLVSRELAEFMTVSNAAPNSIDIVYSPSNLKYNVNISSRMVEVTVFRTMSSDKIVKETKAAKTTVDFTGYFEQVKSFVISQVNGLMKIQAY